MLRKAYKQNTVTAQNGRTYYIHNPIQCTSLFLYKDLRKRNFSVREYRNLYPGICLEWFLVNCLHSTACLGRDRNWKDCTSGVRSHRSEQPCRETKLYLRWPVKPSIVGFEDVNILSTRAFQSLVWLVFACNQSRTLNRALWQTMTSLN